MSTRDQDYRIYQEKKEPIKGKAGKVYSINREKVISNGNIKNEPVLALTPVKTLNEWFANLPLIYKLDLYNSYSGVITKHLK